MTDIEVLDLFSAAAGGWSLGMHRAGFTTIAACEYVDWRRALYQQNNPGVRIYDDVCTLTADRLMGDFGRLPSIVVGSPPCQDISSANTKGKGVEGERSGLYFEAVRIIGEVRPRWFALENSSNLRTRGADAVLAALEGLGYACWSFVVRAGDIGANHERPRSWLIGCDVGQVTNASVSVPERRYEMGGRGRWPEGSSRDRPYGRDLRSEQVADAGKAERWQVLDCGSDRDGQTSQRSESADRHTEHAPTCNSDAAYSDGIGRHEGWSGRWSGINVPVSQDIGGNVTDTYQAGQADGRMVSGLRQAEVADYGRGTGRSNDGSIPGQMGICETDSGDAAGQPAIWSLDDLTAHLQLDDGLSSWVASTRIAVGGPRGTSAASLIVEAFGDAVVPQIPEAIGRAILRTEAALAAIYGKAAA